MKRVLRIQLNKKSICNIVREGSKQRITRKDIRLAFDILRCVTKGKKLRKSEKRFQITLRVPYNSTDKRLTKVEFKRYSL